MFSLSGNKRIKLKPFNEISQKLKMFLGDTFINHNTYTQENRIYTWVICTYGMNKNGSHFFSPSLSLSSFPSSPTPLLVFVPAFLFLSFRLVLISKSRSAFYAILSHDMSLAGCLELRPTVNLWITCPCSLNVLFLKIIFILNSG